MSLSVCILGAGSWGTTLAVLLARAGRDVRLWGRSSQTLDEIRILGENRTYLPGVTLPERISAMGELEAAVDGIGAIIYAVPSQGLREIARRVGASSAAPELHLSVAKGIELRTLMRMTEVLADELREGAGGRIAALCGPTLAREVAIGMPSAAVAAAAEEAPARLAQDLLMTDTFRVYTNSDVAGVELASALKNVVAIAAGISDGLGYGDNTRGALITRGLAEMVRMATVLGGRRETFAGLAGLGDLVTTCSSGHSRNHQVGVEIARGRALAEILEEMVMVAEGVETTRAVRELAVRHRVDMPIATEVHEVLFESKDPREAIRDLMLRRPRAEVWR
jgi:glycerol-3-phosphate dehydrogenase (NAD(P)+)